MGWGILAAISFAGILAYAAFAQRSLFNRIAPVLWGVAAVAFCVVAAYSIGIQAIRGAEASRVSVVWLLVCLFGFGGYLITLVLIRDSIRSDSRDAPTSSQEPDQ